MTRLDPIQHPDLEAVLHIYGIEVRSYGAGWRKISCPVHDESNPSCTVNFDLGKIHCHACGFNGDGLDLVREKEGVGLADAIEFLREKGIGTGDEGVRGGPARKPRSGVSGDARNRATYRRDAASRLRRPGRPD